MSALDVVVVGAGHAGCEAAAVCVCAAATTIIDVAIRVASIDGLFRSIVGRRCPPIALSLLSLPYLLQPPLALLRIEGGNRVEDAYRRRQVLLGDTAQLRYQCRR